MNPVKISMNFQWKFQWNANGTNLKSSWNFNEIPMEIQVEISIILMEIIGNPVENSVKISM